MPFDLLQSYLPLLSSAASLKTSSLADTRGIGVWEPGFSSILIIYETIPMCIYLLRHGKEPIFLVVEIVYLMP